MLFIIIIVYIELLYILASSVFSFVSIITSLLMARVLQKQMVEGVCELGEVEHSSLSGLFLEKPHMLS